MTTIPGLVYNITVSDEHVTMDGRIHTFLGYIRANNMQIHTSSLEHDYNGADTFTTLCINVIVQDLACSISATQLRHKILLIADYATSLGIYLVKYTVKLLGAVPHVKMIYNVGRNLDERVLLCDEDIAPVI